jgi:hypothetical protein
MGTSSMYGGPNRSPLLPPDFKEGEGDYINPNPQDKSKQQQEVSNLDGKSVPADINHNEIESEPQKSSYNNPQYTSWRTAKYSMSKYASGNAGINGKKNAISNYIRSHGGSHNAAKSAKSAIRTTIKIGDFFSEVSKQGITQVLKDYQILTDGRKPKEILNDIVNVLAPTPNLKDDSVARKALVNTMSIIYEKFDDENKDISLLDSLDPDISNVLITKYIETFIYDRLINDVGSRIEKKAENANVAAMIEKDLKDYIETKVSTTLKDKTLSIINSGTKNVNILVEGLYQQCYKVLEDQL